MVELQGFLITIVSGIALGSIYALISMGLTLQWGTVKTLNFAHGALFTWGAYLTWFTIVGVNRNFGYIEAFSLMIPVTFLMGALLESGVIRPLRPKPGSETNIFIATLAVSIFLQNLALFFFGGRLKRLPRIFEGFAAIGIITISLQEIIIIIVAPSILVIMLIFLKKSKIGMAVRATAQDKEDAQLMGISTERVYIYTIGLSTVMAGIAGALLGSIYFLTPTMGSDPLLKAFIVVVFGGLGSIKGTMYAAYIVGLLEALAMFYAGIFWAAPILFAVMIIILSVRPRGLFGEAI